MVFFSIGDELEIAGKKEEEMEASWWHCRVLAVNPSCTKYTVEWLDIIDDEDGGRLDVTHNVPRNRLRVPPPDDSSTVCPQDREINDPVDVWYKDGWWEGLISNLYDDSCTVYFPSTDEYYSGISVDDEEGRLVRSGYAWKEDSWTNVPRRRRGMFDVNVNDHRSKKRREGPRKESGAEGKGSGSKRPGSGSGPLKKKSKAGAEGEEAVVPEGLPHNRKDATLGMLIERGLLVPGDIVFPSNLPGATLGWVEEDGSISVGGAAPLRTDATATAPKQYKDHVAPDFMKGQPSWLQVAARLAVDGGCRRLMALRDAMYAGETAPPPPAPLKKITPPTEAQLREVEVQRSGGFGSGDGGGGGVATESEYVSAPEESDPEASQDSEESEQSQPSSGAAAGGEQQDDDAEDEDSDLAPEIFDSPSGSEASASSEEEEMDTAAAGLTSPPAAAPASESEDEPLLARKKRLSLSPLGSPPVKKAKGLAPAPRALQKPPPATQAAESSPSSASLDAGRKAKAQVSGLLKDFEDSDDRADAGPSLSPVKLTPSKKPAAADGAGAAPLSVKERLREEDGPKVRKQSFKALNSPAKGAAPMPAAAAAPPAAAAAPQLKAPAAPKSAAAKKLPAAPATAKPAVPKPAAAQGKKLAAATAATAVALKKTETKKKAAPAAPAARSAAPSKPFVIPKRASGAPTSTAAAPSKAAPSNRRALVAASASQPSKDNVWCLDNVPQWVTRQALLKALERAGVAKLVGVDVPCVPLDVGESHPGYAVLKFASKEDAAAAEPVLRTLCLQTTTCPVPRPLLLRRPWLTAGYPWGSSPQLPGHLPLANATVTPHFAQPGSLEFEMAIEWRAKDRTAAIARNEQHTEHARELASVLRAYLDETGVAEAVPATAAAEAALATPPPRPDTNPSAFLWLRGVGPQVTEKALSDAFSQFGFPQMVSLQKDAVTRRSRGVAVVRMESAERAAAVAQNMQEMVFLLGGSPRPLSVEVAVPGGPRGSQSVYDRALGAAFGQHDEKGGAVELISVPEEPGEGATAEERAAAVCRALLRVQAEEACATRAAARDDRAALAEEQKKKYKRANDKLLRLKALHDQPAFRRASELHQLPLKKYTRGGAAALLER